MYSITHVRNTRFGLVFCGLHDNMHYLCYISTAFILDENEIPIKVKGEDSREYNIVVKRSDNIDSLLDFAYEEIDATPFSLIDLDMGSFPYSDLRIPDFVWACACGVILANRSL